MNPDEKDKYEEEEEEEEEEGEEIIDDGRLVGRVTNVTNLNLTCSSEFKENIWKVRVGIHSLLLHVPLG